MFSAWEVLTRMRSTNPHLTFEFDMLNAVVFDDVLLSILQHTAMQRAILGYVVMQLGKCQ